MASVCAGNLHDATACELAAFRRSGVLERRTQRLIVVAALYERRSLAEPAVIERRYRCANCLAQRVENRLRVNAEQECSGDHDDDGEASERANDNFASRGRR